LKRVDLSAYLPFLVQLALFRRTDKDVSW